MTENWSHGSIDPFWSTENFKDLDYYRLAARKEYVEEWKEIGYDKVKNFTGKSYDNSNPMPEWTERFRSIFTLSNMSFTFYKMETLDIMPPHKDVFTKYIHLNQCEPHSVRRILIMLEDWKPGHYFEIDGKGIIDWKAGDWFMWTGDVSHASSNIGVDDRYTLQITGIDYAVNDIWQNLHWFNFTDLPTKKTTENSNRMRSMDKVLKNNDGVPYYIYLFNQELKDLENINHSPDVVTQLYRTGIDIYLYEPICSYDGRIKQINPPMGNKYTLQFYSEFSNEIFENTGHLRCAELDSIEKYMKNNSLHNVRVHTCDYDISKYYPAYSSKMQLYTNDLFVKTFSFDEFEELYEGEDTGNFTKRFICLNYRYTPHRQLIAAYLSSLGSVHLTWYFKAYIQSINAEPWFDLNKWRDKDEMLYIQIEKGMKYLKQNSPLTIDLSITEGVEIKHSYFKQIVPPKTIYDYKHEVNGIKMDMLKDAYNDSFCEIVAETRFAQPTANFSEKTMRAMFYKKPFILLAPPHTLEYLRELGFKTFNQWWDEYYDEILDPEQRFFRALESINSINFESIEVLRERYKEMEEVLEHNRKHLIENFGINGFHLDRDSEEDE